MTEFESLQEIKTVVFIFDSTCILVQHRQVDDKLNG